MLKKASKNAATACGGARNTRSDCTIHCCVCEVYQAYSASSARPGTNSAKLCRMRSRLIVRRLAKPQLEAAVERMQGRKCFVRGRCLAGGELTAEGEALFVAMGAEWLAALKEATP